jgi:hypothetical protein
VCDWYADNKDHKGYYGVFYGTNPDAALSVADNPALHLTTGVTVFCWIHPTTPPAGGGVKVVPLVSKDDPAGARDWSLVMHSASNQWYLRWECSVRSEKGGGALRAEIEGPLISFGVFHSVAATYDGRGLRLYLDGAPAAAREGPAGELPPTANPVRMSPCAGSIDLIRIYNIALAPEEIQALHKTGR